MTRLSWTWALALVCLPALAAAQEPTGFTWQNATEVSYVSTSGNSSSQTFGLKGTLEGSGGPHELTFEVGGVKASSDVRTLRAVGTQGDFSIVETVRSETTAESYFARGRYDRSFGVGFGFAGGGWERNTFSGIQNRFQIVGGVGRSFIDSDAGRLKADLGLTYTIQKDVEPAPGADEGFGGWRVSVDAARTLTETARLQSQLVMNSSFSETDDVRLDWANSLSVAISEALQLKTSVQLLWDNRPALLSVPLETTGGTPTGTTVLTPSEKLDSVVTFTLVIQI